MHFKNYFQPHEEYFWELGSYEYANSDTHFVYQVSHNDATIVYAEYLDELLEKLSEQSLPPFGSLLMAITATNYGNEGALQSIKQILQAKEVKRAFPNVNLYNVDAAFVFLYKLVQLPEMYKTEEKRVLLFQTIFHNCHNRVSRENAKFVLATFAINKEQFRNENEKKAFNELVFHKEIKTLALLNSSFPTVNSIIKAMEGLPETTEMSEELAPEITDQELLSKDQKDFVEELIENNKTFHVGSLIRRLWSGLKIPLHHNLPSNQPLGGISDITNKGDFDKLLISEFANDDLVFMSRIANNEALYIEREVPPEEDKFTRDLLIDSTLKNWGNPKVVAFASALAIAKHPKSDIDCKLFVLGKDCKEVGFETVHQVIDGLNLLSGKLEASLGLTHYFETYKGNSEKETFLILSEESFKLAALQKVLHENFDSVHYILLVTADGGISFFKIANKGKKLIQKMQLPLNELWQRKHQPQGLLSKSDSNAEVPVLLPLDRNYKSIFCFESVFYTHWNGNLYQFEEDSFGKGVRKIAGGISFGNKAALYENRLGQKTIVSIDNYYQQLALYTIETKEEIKTQLPTVFKPDRYMILVPAEKCVHIFDGYHRMAWSVTDDGTVEPIAGSNLTDYMSYRDKIDRFIYDFKRNKSNKFTIIKKFETIYVNLTPETIEINGYELRQNYFGLVINDDYKFHEIKPKVNLIFKRAGSNRISTIKTIKERLSLSLSEANEIVETELAPVLTYVDLPYAEEIKYAIEDTGAVCYIETIGYRSVEGSTITIKDAVVEFESHDKSIPTFYIPFVIDKPTALASQTEFAGNEFFLPENSNLEKITVEEFHLKYITPFIKKIIEDEVDTQTT